MRITPPKNNLVRNIPHKIFALVIGYHLWLMVSSLVPAHRWLEVPLCFYATPQDITIQAPETIRLALAGSRTDLYHLDTKILAVHIDSHALTPGSHTLTLSQEQLLLPRTVHVAHWSPSNMEIIAYTKDPLN